MPRSPPSTASSAISMAARACSRCCGRIPIWLRWWRGCWAQRRGSPTRSRCIRSSSIRSSIAPVFFGALAGPARLAAGLAASLAEADSYEDFLDRMRRFAQEQGFLIGARILSGTVSAQQAGEAFAAVADAIVRTLHAKVTEIVRASHGEVPGGDAVVLAMGKLGGREMTA